MSLSNELCSRVFTAPLMARALRRVSSTTKCNTQVIEVAQVR